MAGTEKTEGESKASDVHRLLSFTLGQEDFAIPLLKVREVIALPDITPIPQAPSYFLGIMNLRGQVISVLDLRAKLGIAAEKGPELSVIIADLGALCVGVVVDSINAVLGPKPGDLSESLELAQGSGKNYVTGVYRREKDLVLLLDIAKTLSLEDHDSIAAAQKRAA